MRKYVKISSCCACRRTLSCSAYRAQEEDPHGVAAAVCPFPLRREMRSEEFCTLRRITQEGRQDADIEACRVRWARRTGLLKTCQARPTPPPPSRTLGVTDASDALDVRGRAGCAGMRRTRWMCGDALGAPGCVGYAGMGRMRGMCWTREGLRVVVLDRRAAGMALPSELPSDGNDRQRRC